MGKRVIKFPTRYLCENHLHGMGLGYFFRGLHESSEIQGCEPSPVESLPGFRFHREDVWCPGSVRATQKLLVRLVNSNRYHYEPKQIFKFAHPGAWCSQLRAHGYHTGEEIIFNTLILRLLYQFIIEHQKVSYCGFFYLYDRRILGSHCTEKNQRDYSGVEIVQLLLVF